MRRAAPCKRAKECEWQEVKSDGGDDTAKRLAKQTEEKSIQQMMPSREILMEENQSVKVGFRS